MTSNFFHPLDLTVSDPAASRQLYELFLGHCGFTLKNAGEDWAGFGLGDKRYPCITLLKAKGRGAMRCIASSRRSVRRYWIRRPSTRSTIRAKAITPCSLPIRTA